MNVRGFRWYILKECIEVTEFKLEWGVIKCKLIANSYEAGCLFFISLKVSPLKDDDFWFLPRGTN